jgi:hypothetical protein
VVEVEVQGDRLVTGFGCDHRKQGCCADALDDTGRQLQDNRLISFSGSRCNAPQRLLIKDVERGQRLSTLPGCGQRFGVGVLK